MRSTMDVDTTVKSLPMNKKSVQKIIYSFCSFSQQLVLVRLIGVGDF